MDNHELLNLAYLRAFRLVAQTGSATRAAAALFRAQSAVTRSLQELEASVGETLFERRSSGMLPTPVGRAVLQRCDRIVIAEADAAEYRVPDGPLVLFFYNPFGLPVMEKVAANVANSFRA